MSATLENTPDGQTWAATRTVDIWRNVAQTTPIVQFFTGMFDVIGVTSEETGEELTIRTTGDRIEIEEGMPDTYDFLVPLKVENVTNMVSHAAKGTLDSFATWRVASVLFTPLTRETLKNPIMSNGALRVLGRVEDLKLVGPDDEHVAEHTLVFAGKQWLVVEGAHGQPRRVFRLTGEQCVEYQKQVFKAMKANTVRGWWRFGRWYNTWRAGVSVRT